MSAPVDPCHVCAHVASFLAPLVVLQAIRPASIGHGFFVVHHSLIDQVTVLQAHRQHVVRLAHEPVRGLQRCVSHDPGAQTGISFSLHARHSLGQKPKLTCASICRYDEQLTPHPSRERVCAHTSTHACTCVTACLRVHASTCCTRTSSPMSCLHGAMTLRHFSASPWTWAKDSFACWYSCSGGSAASPAAAFFTPKGIGSVCALDNFD
jgi:hypothetical protein